MNETTDRSHFTPYGWRTITPRIVVHDAKGLVGFLKVVFGATGEYQQARPSEIRIGDSLRMITDSGVRKPMPAFLYCMSTTLTRPFDVRWTRVLR